MAVAGFGISNKIGQHQQDVSGREGVLSPEKNRLLTQVGPGTPMGDYLRRYWQPIGGASELDDNPIKADPPAGRGPRALQGPAAAGSGCSTGTVRTAAPTSPTASSRRPASAATITAG